mgnify:CR=1 FL=1
MFKRLLLWFTHPYRVQAKPLGSLPETVYYRREPPERTEKMIRDGFVWTEKGDGWTEVCLTCGGNCGQCGTSLGMGNPVKMDRLIESTGMNHPVAGLPRG